jgi:SAM-dependent methyltransferase
LSESAGLPGAEGRAFEQYAAWYDAFNEGKDYGAEARYVVGKVKAWQPAPASWLDLGCGTGKHLAFLQSQGICVEGVDASPAMIARARMAHPEILFHVADARDFRVTGKRDVIGMLFHVLSYQTSDPAVAATFASVSAHLAPRGVFVFDFWHTEGVLRDPPGVRVRETRVQGRRLFRIARPTEDRERSLIDIRYEFRWDAPEGPVASEERHVMRHFTKGELEMFLRDAGLEILQSEGWMQPGSTLGPEHWYGLICARKRDGT